MNRIEKEYDRFFLIKNPELASQFHYRNFRHTPFIYYIALIIFLGFFFVTQFNNCFYHLRHDQEYFSLSVIELIVMFINLIFGLYLTKLKFQKVNINIERSIKIRISMIVLLTISLCVRYTEIVMLQSCFTYSSDTTDILCHSKDVFNIMIVTAPIIYVAVFKCYFFRITLFSFMCTVFFPIIQSIREKHYVKAFVLLLFALGGVTTLYELQAQSVSMFLLNNKLKNTLNENEKNADQVHADEMRHMIANVAHDLKTPLTSFMTGMEFISHITSDCQEKLDFDQCPRQNLTDNMLSIHQCLENIRNTNSFMLMTINRCIDYTKASKGMKLVPRYETIDLFQTLKLPMSCMKNIQNREITLFPIPKAICQNIITDQQWLQENMLCLLSNAVKYSTGGGVNITVSLIEENVSKPRIQTLSLFKTADKYIPSPKMGQIAPLTIHEDHSYHDSSNIFQSSLKNLNISDDQLDKFINTQSSDNFIQTKQILFEIEDTGIGMSDEAMASLFNPFKQTQRLAGGTGLGLYSLAKRVEALNGKYGVRRRKDGKQGSLFWFSIPYKPDDSYVSGSHQSVSSDYRIESILSFDSADEHKPLAVREESSGSIEVIQIKQEDTSFSGISGISNPDKPSFSTYHSTQSLSAHSQSWSILLVDDSPTILKMTTLILSKLGHNVMTAENGEQAVKKIEKQWNKNCKSFDIILMDLQMPVMDGLEASRRIRAIEKRKGMTSFESQHQILIGFSANSDNETTEEALQAGFDAFIPKPFKIEAFYSVANRLLQ